MPTEIIQMWGQGSGGSENAIGTVDIPFDGNISQVAWAFSITFDAIGEFFYAELSFIATDQNARNDARGVISNVRQEFGGIAAATGVATFGFNVANTINDLRVQGGERLHLHLNASAGLVSNTNLLIHLETTRGGTQRRAGRRRFA